MPASDDDFAIHVPSRPVLVDGSYVPNCIVCGEPFEPDDEDEVIIALQPMLLEKSSRSGRCRLTPCEFATDNPGLNGQDRIYLHAMCMVDQLLDPSLIGWNSEE